MEKEYKNIGYFFLILMAFVIVGFFKTYFGLFPTFDPNTTFIVHFHVTVLTLWTLMLIVQPILVRTKKLELHRLLGKLSYVLVPLIILSFIGMMHKQFNEGLEQKMPTSENWKGLYVPIGQLILFTTFYSLAIINKKNVAKHMRYIIATALVLISPSLARIGFFWLDIDVFKSVLYSFLFADIILVGLIFFDKRNGRNFNPYLTTLVSFIVYQIGWFILWHP